MVLDVQPVITVLEDKPETERKAYLEWLGQCLRDNGHLVVFPTETVYGLGANALNREAVLRIFEAKNRPLSDPVICHVSSFEDALKLYSSDEDPFVLAVIECLSHEFWPGPLTLVARASSRVFPEVTANTGFVSVRCPRNQLALELIRSAGVPIAAPSANRFGHISPSCAAHVAKDFRHLKLQEGSNGFFQTSLHILDGGDCNVGIESTVCKVELKDTENPPVVQLTILRRGHVSAKELEKALQKRDEALKTALSKISNTRTFPRIVVRLSDRLEQLESSLRENDALRAVAEGIIPNPQMQPSSCSPGTSITHYAPSLPTFLLSVSPAAVTSKGTHIRITVNGLQSQDVPLSSCILIDSFGMFSRYASSVRSYFDLSCHHHKNGAEDYAVAAMQHQLFLQLHQAEDIAVQQTEQQNNFSSIICIADFRTHALRLGEAALAVYDRLYRAASGQRAMLIVKSNS